MKIPVYRSRRYQKNDRDGAARRRRALARRHRHHPACTVLRPQALPPVRRYRRAAAHRQRDEPPATRRRRARAEPSAPELPAFAEPDENEHPYRPAPEFADRIVMALLDVAVPRPTPPSPPRPCSPCSAPQAPPPVRATARAAAHRQRDEPPATVRRRARAELQRARLPAFAEPRRENTSRYRPSPRVAERIVMAPLDVAARPTPPSPPARVHRAPPRKHLHQSAATVAPLPTVSAMSPRDPPSPRPWSSSAPELPAFAEPDEK